MYNLKSNTEILEELNLHVRGHIEAKKALINLVRKSKIRYKQRYVHLNRDYHLIEADKILLLGQSGTGKTHLVESLKRIIDFPLLKIDATILAPTGAGGGLDSEALKELIKKTAEDLVSTSIEYHSVPGVIGQMVVFIDEIDKLARPFESSGGWNRRVQESFLTLFDNHDAFRGVSFIFAGAFTGIDEQLEINNKTSIGFSATTHSTREIDWSEEVIKYGLVPELVGRIRGVYALDTLTACDYKDILNTILVPKKREELLYFNHIGFSLTSEQTHTIVDKALKSGQGVRCLKRELDRLCQDVEFNYEDSFPELVQHIKLGC